MSEQTPPQASPPQQTPYPPYDPYWRFYPPPPQQQGPRAMDRLTWKQKIILGIVLVLLVLSLGLWNSFHSTLSDNTKSQQAAPVLAPNPRSIESQKEAAERELAAAEAAAAAARNRLEEGPTVAPTPAPVAGVRQDPDAEFWHQMRQAKWRREQEAPYASGVGFITRRPREDTTGMVPSNPQSHALSETATQPGLAGPQQAAPQLGQPVNSPQAPPNQHATLDHADGPLHRLDEGTIISATLLNQLDGEFTGPVICQVSENVSDASGLNLLIPAGSRVLGEAHPVNSNNQRRLAVSFHRITMPDEYSLSLDKAPGLNQQGASALSGKVNNHFLQTFGMSAAVGAIAGLAQIGNTGSPFSPWWGFRQGVSQQTAMTSEQILNRYLNRLPTITIKPGSRVKIILLADIPDVPEYAHHQMPVNP